MKHPAQITAARRGRMYGNTNDSYPFFSDEVELSIFAYDDRFNALKRGFDNYELFSN